MQVVCMDVLGMGHCEAKEEAKHCWAVLGFLLATGKVTVFVSTSHHACV